MASVHVPAWKRLGLKLKSQALDSSNDQPAPSVPVERSNISKKRKLTSNGTSSVIASNDEFRKTEVASQANTKDATSVTGGASKPSKKRKSVTFDIDVKPVDGPAEPDDESEVASVVASPVKSISAEKKQKRKERKPKALSASGGPSNGVSPSQTPVRPYLQYLKQHHTDKADWKFNKNRQTQLLQDIFNIYRIPPEYNDALEDYVSGLQGVAARSRLKQDAQAIITKHGVDSNDVKADEDAQVEDAKIARARVIVAALSSCPPPTTFFTGHSDTALSKDKFPSESSSTEQPRQRKTRGRKRRAELDVSSSSSSSSEDTSSEESSSESSSDDEA